MPRYDDSETDPDTIMDGSPFAIPAKPGQSEAALRAAFEYDDMRGFFTALGLIFGLTALVGLSVLPGL